jgi:phosphatidylinositol phospholipase C, delta
MDELTFVRFTVRDDEIGRDDLAAWACVRLDRLGDGYRFVHLLDANARLTEGVILLKVEKQFV